MDKVANFSGLCVNLRCIRHIKGFSQYRFFRFTRKEEQRNTDLANAGEFATTCDVEVQALDDWSPLDNSSERLGFLKFAPDLNLTPVTDTTPPDNVLEVNKHFRSCEHRMQPTEKLKFSEALRDMVYTRKKEPFHWSLDTDFEENGDYLVDRDVNSESGVETLSNQATPEEEEEPYPTNFSYSLNYFIAVKPELECTDPFWIARTLRIAEISDDGNFRKLTVRWYQAKDKNDAFNSIYVMSTYIRKWSQTVFDDTVDVRSILYEFGSLTRRGNLHTRTQKAFRQTLNMH